MCQRGSSGLLDLNSASRLCARITWKDKVSLRYMGRTQVPCPDYHRYSASIVLYHCRKMSEAALSDLFRYASSMKTAQLQRNKTVCLEAEMSWAIFERWLVGCNQRMRASCTHWSSRTLSTKSGTIGVPCKSLAKGLWDAILAISSTCITLL